MTLSSQYPRLCKLADEILEYYELPQEQMFFDILIEFTREETLNPRALDFINYKLKVASIKVQRGYYKTDEIPLPKQLKPIVSKEVWVYVRSHYDQQIRYYDFIQIENGFRLMWNYSKKDVLVSTDFIRVVDHYLSSMEIPYDRGKMVKVVDLILEYLDELGYWNGFPF
jgi:hypothetical protein